MVQVDKQTTKVETIYGSFLSWEGDLITDQLETYSAHTRNELSMLSSVILPGDTIIDIGAHIGTFSIPFSKFNKKRGMIFSFEANPNNYLILQKNIDLNELSKVIIPIHAVVSARENLKFSISLPEGGNSGMYYCKPNTVDSEAAVSSLNIDEWHCRTNKGKRVDLIKIDVEGAELQVLQSCKKTIEEYKPVLYIEISTDALKRFNATNKDIENLLSPHGYHLFRNIGPRNSTNDTFKIARLKTIKDGGEFFDLLAIHPSDIRYPQVYLGRLSLYFFQIKSNALALIRRLFRFTS